MQLLEYIWDFRKVTVGERVTRYKSIKRNIGTSHTCVCMCQEGRACAHTREDVRLEHGGVGVKIDTRSQQKLKYVTLATSFETESYFCSYVLEDFGAFH